MTFPDAVKSALSQYVGFSGRARRSEYWWFFLFTTIVGIVASTLDSVLFAPDPGSTRIIGPLYGLAALALLLPSLAVGVRRLHDTDRTGWWLLIGLVPIVGWILLIVWYCQDSGPDNQYGPSPKGGAQDAAQGAYPPPPPPTAPPA